MGLVAYGGLLGIGFVFALLLTVIALLHVWRGHSPELPYLGVIDVLTAAGAWLCFHLADAVGFSASIEWDPVSPP